MFVSLDTVLMLLFDWMFYFRCLALPLCIQLYIFGWKVSMIRSFYRVVVIEKRMRIVQLCCNLFSDRYVLFLFLFVVKLSGC